MRADYVPGAGLPLDLPLGSPTDTSFPQVSEPSGGLRGTNTPHPSAAETHQRVSRKKIDWLSEHLPERDRRVLELVAAHRYLTTRQLERFVFTTHASEDSAARTARRVLSRLERLLLLQSLERRIGGIRAGSAARIWQLTTASARLLRSDGVDFRRSEPSQRFLRHCLAIADVHLALRDLATSTLQVKVQTEPEAWRSYLGPGGERRTLEPDLAAVLETDAFEERWFLEIDLGTESLPTLLRKCGQYEHYRASGQEQNLHGSFPLVWWVLSSTERAQQLQRAIQRSPTLTPGMYRVTTFAEVMSALREAAQ